MKQGLNLGAGRTRPNAPDVQFVNMDISKNCGAEIVRDALRGLPWNDNTFDVVYASHFLEHFDGEDFVFLMNEIHRVLKPAGELRILSPYREFWGAWIDPHHKRFMDEHTFEPFWMPNHDNQEMGVMGWYEPRVIEVAEKMELRIVMRKIAGDDILKYLHELVDKRGDKFTPAGFIEACAGNTFYKPDTNHEWRNIP